MLMSESKLPFEERIPIVLKIINEAKEPIGYTELHEKVKAATGIKISKHTLNKCLDYLLFNRQIEKNEIKGRGNPVKYSINHDSFVSKPNERIEAYAHVFERLLDDNSPFGTEANQYRIIADEISLLTTRLIMRLFIYSIRTDRRHAFDDYKSAIKTELVPYMLQISKLVKPPLTMSSETFSLLKIIFHENVANFCKKQNHSLEKIPEDELRDLLSWYLSEYKNESSEYVYQKTEVPERSDINRFGESKYLGMYVEEKEILSKTLQELRRKKNNG